MSQCHDEPVIAVEGLCKSFLGREVVHNLSLDVKKGEVFGFLGPNGSGKTTTIRMLCGLLTPDAGSGHCLGFDICRQSDLIKQHIGYMTQKFSLYTDLTVEENLVFVARVYGLTEPREAVLKIMNDLALFPKRHQLAANLSGGWKQRLALAACLLHQPKLLLLDEPTAGVDPIARREFWDKIHSLSEQGITTLVSTHYMDEAERCSRLAYLASGTLLVTGSVQDVIDMTDIKTWTIKGAVTWDLLRKIRTHPAIVQAAFFGSQIHVCAYDSEKAEQALNELLCEYQSAISWQPVASTLEDAFISLVNQSKGQLGQHV